MTICERHWPHDATACLCAVEPMMKQHTLHAIEHEVVEQRLSHDSPNFKCSLAP